MKNRTKEAIRSKIIKYAGMVWNTKRVEEIHPLVRLMIEEVCNELYLLDNKLHDIEADILEKLVENIIPSLFSYVRAGSAIVQIRPAHPKFHLSRKTEFILREMPEHLLGRHLEKVAFSPVTDIRLNNLGISHLFYHRRLWDTGHPGNRKLLAEVEGGCPGNTLWLLIDNPAGLRQVKDLYFYIDFPHLSDTHDYYHSLSLMKWKAGGTALEVEEGLPLLPGSCAGGAESEVLSGTASVTTG